MITEEQSKNVAFCKNYLMEEIRKVVTNSNNFRDSLTGDIIVSIVYLDIFSSYLQDKKFDNLEEAWRFMQDIKGIIEKVSYVNNYLGRLQPKKVA